MDLRLDAGLRAAVRTPHLTVAVLFGAEVQRNEQGWFAQHLQAQVPSSRNDGDQESLSNDNGNNMKRNERQGVIRRSTS